MKNCIAVENTDDSIFNEVWQKQIRSEDEEHPTLVSYSCIQDDDADDASIPFGGGGSPYFNIDDDPMFVNVALDDFSLMAESPCIDRALNDAVPADAGNVDDDNDEEEPTPLDVEKKWRFVAAAYQPGINGCAAAIVDMGALEYSVDYAGPTTCGPNGIPDALDIALCNADPECEPIDVNENGILDILEDCNNNGYLDDEDIAEERSTDCNENCIPDECEAIIGEAGFTFDIFMILPAEMETIAADGDWLLVGSPVGYTPTFNGTVHFFHWDISEWVGPDSFAASSPEVGDLFGAALAMGGGRRSGRRWSDRQCRRDPHL